MSEDMGVGIIDDKSGKRYIIDNKTGEKIELTEELLYDIIFERTEW